MIRNCARDNMFYNETSIEGVLSEAAFAARTGDYSTVSSLLNTSGIAIQGELKKCQLGHDELKNISFSLETITFMLQTQNWVALADVLEYEFLPLWKSTVESREEPYRV